MLGPTCVSVALDATAVLILTDADDGRIVEGRAGDIVMLHLSENASTGYRWTVDAHDADLVALTTDAREPATGASDAAVGSAGLAIFRAQILRPGSSRLVLLYRRPWEPATAAMRSFALTIHAAP